MQYALLIYEPDAESFPAGEDDPAWQALLKQHEAYAAELAQAGKLTGGSGLRGTHAATTVRVTPEGRTVHDGPFAETREQLGGLYIVEAADLDEALEIARRLPMTGSGSIEVRPCIDESRRD